MQTVRALVAQPAAGIVMRPTKHRAPSGGADNAPMSDQIELWLHKSVCVTLENLKSQR